MPWHFWNHFPGSLSRHPMTQRDGSSDPAQPFGNKTQADSNIRFLHNLSDIIVCKLYCTWNMCAIVHTYTGIVCIYIDIIHLLPYLLHLITYYCFAFHNPHRGMAPSNHQSDSSNVRTHSHPFWHRGYCTQETLQHSSAKTCVAVLRAMNGLQDDWLIASKRTVSQSKVITVYT